MSRALMGWKLPRVGENNDGEVSLESQPQETWPFMYCFPLRCLKPGCLTLLNVLETEMCFEPRRRGIDL